MHNNFLTEEQIEKAVNWWADRVCHPKFDGLSDEERLSGQHKTYEFGEALAMMLVEPVEDNQREKFISSLKELLTDKEFNPWWGLGVDYSPDLTLAKAAEKAGVSLNNFPWKTYMSFKDDGMVKASCGYGAPAEEI